MREMRSNWLAENLAEAPSDYAMSFTRDTWNGQHEMLDADDAARLRDKLAERYRNWTGRDLAADLATPRPAPNSGGEDA